MDNLNTILFPTDFTDDAAQAYSYALEVAVRAEAKLHLLHAIEEPYDFATRIEETIAALKKEAEKKFDGQLAELKKEERYQNLEVEYHVRRGKPAPVINDMVEEDDFDLLIMGTKGESSIKRILYGNVTSDLILDTRIPIMTVPKNSKKPYLDRFLFATDFRSKDMEALAATVNLARVFEAEVHVMHVSEQKELSEDIQFRGFKDLVKESFDYDNIQFRHIKSERFSKGISEFLDEYPVSLIVITRYKKVFLRTLLWANNTQELTYHTTVPMLVMIPEAL